MFYCSVLSWQREHCNFPIINLCMGMVEFWPIFLRVLEFESGLAGWLINIMRSSSINGDSLRFSGISSEFDYNGSSLD